MSWLITEWAKNLLQNKGLVRKVKASQISEYQRAGFAIINDESEIGFNGSRYFAMAPSKTVKQLAGEGKRKKDNSFSTPRPGFQQADIVAYHKYLEQYASYRRHAKAYNMVPLDYFDWFEREVDNDILKEKEKQQHHAKIRELSKHFANPEGYLRDLATLTEQYFDHIPQERLDALNRRYDRHTAQIRATYAQGTSKGFEIQNQSFSSLPESPEHPDFVSLDIETTGLKQTDSTTGVAAVRYRWNPYEKRYVISNVFNRFYFAKGGDREYLYNAEGIRISKYDKARVKELRAGQSIKYGKYWDESQQEALLSFIGDSKIIGHNVMGFDLPHLFGAQLYDTVASKFKGGVIDTLMLAEAYRGAGKERNTLDRLFKETFGVTMEQAGLPHHDALADVKATALLIQAWAGSKGKSRLNITSRWALSNNIVSTRPFESMLSGGKSAEGKILPDELSEIKVAGRDRIMASEDFDFKDALNWFLGTQGEMDVMSRESLSNEEALSYMSSIKPLMEFMTSLAAVKGGGTEGWLREPGPNTALRYAPYLKGAFVKGGKEAMFARLMSISKFKDELSTVASFAELENIVKKKDTGRKGAYTAYEIINNSYDYLSDLQEGKAKTNLGNFLRKNQFNPLVANESWFTDLASSFRADNPGDEGWSRAFKRAQVGLYEAEANSKQLKQVEAQGYKDWLMAAMPKNIETQLAREEEERRYAEAETRAREMGPEGKYRKEHYKTLEYGEDVYQNWLSSFEDVEPIKTFTEALKESTDGLKKMGSALVSSFGGNWWTGESIRQTNVSQFGGLMHDASGLFQGPLKLFQAPLYSFANAESLRLQSAWDANMANKELGLSLLDKGANFLMGAGSAMTFSPLNAIPGATPIGLTLMGLGGLGKLGGGISQMYGQKKTRETQSGWEALRSQVSNLSGIAEVIAIPFKVAAASVSMFSTSLFRLSKSMLGWFDRLSRGTAGASVGIQAYTNYTASDLEMYKNLQAGTFHGINIPEVANSLANAVTNFQSGNNAQALGALGILGDALEDPGKFGDKLPDLMTTAYNNWSSNRQGAGGWFYDAQVKGISEDLFKLMIEYKAKEQTYKDMGFASFGDFFNAGTVARIKGGNARSSSNIELETKVGEREAIQEAKDKAADTVLTAATQPYVFDFRDWKNQMKVSLAKVLNGEMSANDFLNQSAVGGLQMLEGWGIHANEGGLLENWQGKLARLAVDFVSFMEPGVKTILTWFADTGIDMGLNFVQTIAPWVDDFFDRIAGIEFNPLTKKVTTTESRAREKAEGNIEAWTRNGKGSYKEMWDKGTRSVEIGGTTYEAQSVDDLIALLAAKQAGMTSESEINKFRISAGTITKDSVPLVKRAGRATEIAYSSDLAEAANTLKETIHRMIEANWSLKLELEITENGVKIGDRMFNFTPAVTQAKEQFGLSGASELSKRTVDN